MSQNIDLLLLVATLGLGTTLSGLVFSSSPRTAANRWFSIMVFLMLGWISAYEFAVNATQEEVSLNLFRISGAFVVLFFVAYYYFIIRFLKRTGWLDLVGKFLAAYSGLLGVLMFLPHDLIMDSVSLNSTGYFPLFTELGFWLFYGEVILFTIFINTLLVSEFVNASGRKKPVFAPL